jgi:hypothetical protein
MAGEGTEMPVVMQAVDDYSLDSNATRTCLGRAVSIALWRSNATT